MGLTQVNTRSHLGQSYHVGTLTLNVPDMKLDLTPCPGSVLEKKFSAYFFGSEIFDILIFLGLEKSLLFFWV